jgi:hypothetical protein
VLLSVNAVYASGDDAPCAHARTHRGEDAFLVLKQVHGSMLHHLVELPLSTLPVPEANARPLTRAITRAGEQWRWTCARYAAAGRRHARTGT